VIEGRFIDEDAYAAVLRGAIAEASGRYDEAVLAYESAGREDQADPLVLMRLGAARCARDPKDARADKAFAKAAELPGALPSLPMERAICAERRAQPRTRDEWLARARTLGADTATKGLGPGTDPDVALAGTIESSTPDDALWSVFTWAMEKQRTDLALYAAMTAVRGPVSPGARGEQAVVLLADHAESALATEVAFGLFRRDAPLGPEGRRRVLDALLRRGAGPQEIDGALPRLHFDDVSAAARALLLGQDALARALVARRLAAEPSLGPACGVALALGQAAHKECDGTRGVWSAEAWLVTVRALLEGGSLRAAQAFAAGVAPPPIDERDPLVLRTAVRLVEQGVNIKLPPGGVLTLSLLRGESVPEPRAAGLSPAYARLWSACRGEGLPPGADATRDPVLHAAVLCRALARKEPVPDTLLLASPDALVRAMQRKYKDARGRP